MSSDPACFPEIVKENHLDVPMRDGVVLRAMLFRPDRPGRFPGLLLRTPYEIAKGSITPFVRSGYAVVTQHSRGRYASGGDFVPFTVPDNGEAEDGYDSVEWLAKQPWCNGRVGTFGISYNAWMQWQLAKLRPPHLQAMCAYSIPLENTEVDYPGGFRPGRRIKWWLTVMAPDLRRRNGLPPPHTPAEANRNWAEGEHSRWLDFLPWTEIVNHLPPGLAEYAEDWFKEPSRRPWRMDEIHREVAVPNLDFSGWYDHCNGSMAHLGLMQKNGGTEAARRQSKLVIGPWNHSGLGNRKTGGIDFGPQAELDLPQMMIRWFDHWLKDMDDGFCHEPAVRYFVMGSGKWKNAATWPPEGLEEETHYLQRGQRLGPAASIAGSDTYCYDPADPMPTLWTPEMFTVPADRRLVAHRKDALIYRTPPLVAAVEIVGYPEVILYASSSAVDTDFFARLVDENPDSGQALEICYGMVRARHRNGLDREDFLTPGEVVEYRIRLGATACHFLKGHRVRLEITSSDYPNHDRNHNTGKNDLIDVELMTATQTVYYGGDRASRLILTVDLAKD